MKAMVFTAYGVPDVLQLQEVAKPVPKENEVLIRIRATTVNTGDCEIRNLKLPLWLNVSMRLMLGIRKPRGTTILGSEFAGEVEAVGASVTRFKPGDEVFGSTGLGFGTNAEYRCLSETASLAIKPSNMVFEEAATVPFGGRDALHFLRQASIQSGQKVLIVGAGGSIGTYAVQMARSFGAEVAAVDSASKLLRLRSIGASRVFDYQHDDFTEDATRYDVIFDTVGKRPLTEVLVSLKPRGVYLLANPRLSDLILATWVARRTGKRIIVGASSDKAEDLVVLREMIEAGKLKAVIDRSYSLDELVKAHRYVDTGSKMGNVTIRVNHAP